MIQPQVPDPADAIQYARNYVNGLIDSDFSHVDSVNRSSMRMRALLRSYARNIATQATGATLRADMQKDSPEIVAETVRILDKLITKGLDAGYEYAPLGAWN